MASKYEKKVSKLVAELARRSDYCRVFYDESEDLVVAQYRGSERDEFDLLVRHVDGDKVKAWIQGPMQSMAQIMSSQGGGRYSPVLYFSTATGAAYDAIDNPHWHG